MKNGSCTLLNENESDFLKNSNLCKACNNIERKVDSEHFCQGVRSDRIIVARISLNCQEFS